jgi:hypothetical protein
MTSRNLLICDAVRGAPPKPPSTTVAVELAYARRRRIDAYFRTLVQEEDRGVSQVQHSTEQGCLGQHHCKPL